MEEMSTEEWESLCDGCAICCSIRLQDEDTKEILHTNVVCRYLDVEQCRCTCYQQRKKFVPECVIMNPQNARQLDWLPKTCAYYLIAHGKDLPDWHPLVSGNPDSVHQSGISLKDRGISEEFVHEDDWHCFCIE